MLCCDLCSSPTATTLYRAQPFGLTTDNQVFGDTPIHVIQGLDHVATEDLHPIYGTGAIMTPDWLACEDCRLLIDAKDQEGLVQHCVTRVSAQQDLSQTDFDEVFKPMYRNLFAAFFLYLVSRAPFTRPETVRSSLRPDT